MSRTGIPEAVKFVEQQEESSGLSQVPAPCDCSACPHLEDKLNNVTGILINALRYLNNKQMHELGKQIAQRSDATFTPNIRISKEGR